MQDVDDVLTLEVSAHSQDDSAPVVLAGSLVDIASVVNTLTLVDCEFDSNDIASAPQWNAKVLNVEWGSVARPPNLNQLNAFSGITRLSLSGVLRQFDPCLDDLCVALEGMRSLQEVEISETSVEGTRGVDVCWAVVHHCTKLCVAHIHLGRVDRTSRSMCMWLLSIVNLDDLRLTFNVDL